MVHNLTKSRIFNNISPEEIKMVLNCLLAYEETFKKSEVVLSIGEKVEKIGIITSGGISAFKNYLDYELTEVRTLMPYDTFGQENVYAGMKDSNYTLIANKDCTVVYIDGKKLIDDSSMHCRFRTQMNINMLCYASQVNLQYQNQIEIRAISSLQERVLLYLKDFSNEEKCFEVPHNREQMAMYLGATRPALSKVLISLKAKGLIDYKKNSFMLTLGE